MAGCGCGTDMRTSSSARTQLSNELYLWLTEHLAVPFSMKFDPAYEVQVNGYALKTRLQLLKKSSHNLARTTLIIGALCGFGIGWWF